MRRITFVPFLADGRCVLVSGPGAVRLPSGAVLPGEDYLLDTVLRVPMETAGFRYQRLHPFAADGDNLYAWIEGAPYRGPRPHATVPLWTGPGEAAARLLPDPVSAEAVLMAHASYRSQSGDSYYADAVRTLERAYLRGSTAEAGSGFGGDAEDWRRARGHLTEAISGSGTFLDVGCANGLLMESVVAWCLAVGIRIEPYGVDLAPGLVRLARSRLPRWADRIWQGNAIDWTAPGGLRFDYVHVLLDLVPAAARAELIRHHLASTVAPGGRLLVSQYCGGLEGGPPAAEALRALGYPVAGQTSGDPRASRPAAPSAWICA